MTSSVLRGAALASARLKMGALKDEVDYLTGLHSCGIPLGYLGEVGEVLTIDGVVVGFKGVPPPEDPAKRIGPSRPS